MLISQHQHHKNCQNFLSQIFIADCYASFKALLLQWRDNCKSAASAMSVFMRIAQLVSDTPKLLEQLNKCLLKEIGLSSGDQQQRRGVATLENIKQLAADNVNSVAILDSVTGWLKSDQNMAISQAAVSATQTVLPRTAPIQKIHHIEQLSEAQFVSRMESHPQCQQIAKLMYLYRRSIITLSEFKLLLQPIYYTDASFFNMLFQYSEQTEAKRRKVTIFASLNQLVDQKYPMEQVGNSYVIIPDGYANYGKGWKSNKLEGVMNRLIVSVPLGSQVSFVIMRKNEYEEQLFNNEEEKYEFDSNIQCMKAVIRQVERRQNLHGPLMQKMLANLYPNENIHKIVASNTEIAEQVILPRLKQKLNELIKCRKKFQKQCEDVASKNFYKSLDYRCFYFCKNDKKFNSQARWEKEIGMRKFQILHDRNHIEDEIEDRESLQRSRNYAFNSFDNITKQQFIENRKVDFSRFDPKKDEVYPPYPDNQILFLFDFSDMDVLNDVLEIVLYHCAKKNTLQLLVFRMFRINIDRKLVKDQALLKELEKPDNGETLLEGVTSGISELLNQTKTAKRNYKDINQQFYDLIEEEIEPIHLQELSFPFEGPSCNTFIATKQCYFFLRFLVTIYQRFLKAKSVSEERNERVPKGRGSTVREPSLYSYFLTILIFKLKEQKYFQQYLRKVMQQEAFIFFTLDKLIGGLCKLIHNINPESLTHKILKEGAKDCDLQIKKWSEFVHPSVTEQLMRLCRENQPLFRFSYSSEDKLVYVSSWQNKNCVSGQETERKKKDNGESASENNFYKYLNDPVEQNEEEKNIFNERLIKRINKVANGYLKSQDEHWQSENGCYVTKGQLVCVNARRRAASSWASLQHELRRHKRVKLS